MKKTVKHEQWIDRQPLFVRNWLRKNVIDVEDDGDDQNEMIGELRDRWEEVCIEFVAEEKYNNLFSVTLKHPNKNRYIQVYEASLPYGITDYGLNEFDATEDWNDVIEEVFPVQETVYRTAKEISEK